MIEPLLSLDDLVRILKVSKRTVYRLIVSGQLPAFRMGFQWRVSEKEFENWLKTRPRIKDRRRARLESV